MKTQELQDFASVVFEEVADILFNKGEDYSGEIDNLRNLKACEKLGLITAERGVLIRMQDKMNRLNQLLPTLEWLTNDDDEVEARRPRVKDESIQDTCDDVIGYMILMKALLKERAENGGGTF